MWYKDYSHVVTLETWDLDDGPVEWCNGYKQCKVLKKRIGKELRVVGRHPSQY